jgi:hypothetical protein
MPKWLVTSTKTYYWESGAWTEISSAAQLWATAGNTFYGSFPGTGVYSWTKAGSWVLIENNAVTPTAMCIQGGELVASWNGSVKRWTGGVWIADTWPAKPDSVSGELGSVLYYPTGAAAGRVMTSDANGMGTWAEPTTSHWKQVPAANFTATPASTATLTMLTDMTTVIPIGESLKYVIGGVNYYGRCGAMSAAELTVNGAPLGGEVTALYYGGGSISQAAYDGSVNVDGTVNTTPLKTGTVYTIPWKKKKSYVVFYTAKQTTHDSHATHGKFTLKVNGTELNTNAGGLVIAADDTEYKTGVDIATGAYVLEEGQNLTFVVTQGGNADGTGLKATAIILTP